MNCRELSQFLMEYVGDTLERDVHENFESHLKACPNCHTYLVQYRETIRAGQLACGDEDCSEVPEDLVQAVLAAISKEPR
ncbi:MAG: zf-HC2 domain-containing protein [Acidobacteria bacterium]|jgi:anti-sigma factor RsiW|nr:zf-HC2 domain-containing protein [Acidobacteriota bacterium]